ncbi:hypothetical protein, partial [Streptomyces diastaticus]|uniref:hypothetical protein n=1 Tax=Streptomyces diastaticus TaxID=1956 RepID=UPI0036507C5C
MTTTPAPRTTANPRRTTLARLTDAAALGRPARRPDAGTLPAATASPRRTLLATTPAVTGPTYGAKLPGQTANPVRTPFTATRRCCAPCAPTVSSGGPGNFSTVQDLQ